MLDVIRERIVGFSRAPCWVPDVELQKNQVFVVQGSKNGARNCERHFGFAMRRFGGIFSCWRVGGVACTGEPGVL